MALATTPRPTPTIVIAAGRRGRDSGRMEPDLAGRPLPDRVVGPGQPPGQVGVEALDALAGAAHSAGRPRPAVLRIDQRVPLGGVGGVGRGDPVGRDGRLGGPDPPVDSRRLTTSRRWGSHSQYRVGIGVPSSRNGALAMTAGVPSSARTTTSKAPAGVRPSSSVTRATSSAPPGVDGPPSGVTSRIRAWSRPATRSRPDGVGRWPAGVEPVVPVDAGHGGRPGVPGSGLMLGAWDGDTSGWSAGSPAVGAPAAARSSYPPAAGCRRVPGPARPAGSSGGPGA